MAARSAGRQAGPYVLPFLVFVVFLEIQGWNPLPQAAANALWIVVLAVVLWIFSRRQIDLHVSNLAGTVAVGLGVFALWVAPDALVPGYREHWLFHNAIVGGVHSSLQPGATSSVLALVLRSLRAILIVPVVEELFWRGWLMRWIVRSDFERVGIGTYTPRAFWLVAILFAAEHGPYWDVGLITGIAYNSYLCRVKRLGDLIWAHAITNAALCLYVVLTHRWELWL